MGRYGRIEGLKVCLGLDPSFTGVLRAYTLYGALVVLLNLVTLGETSTAVNIGNVSLKPGDKVCADLGKANLDVRVFDHHCYVCMGLMQWT